MKKLLKRLWADDVGGVISVEMVLIIAILIFGLIPGLIALRNSGISLMATLGNLMQSLVPSFTFSGFSLLVGTPPNQTTIVQVNGISFTPNTTGIITGSQIPPHQVTGLVIPPAP